MADPESDLVLVGVESDCFDSGFEVDAEASNFGGEEEDVDAWLVIEAVDNGFPLRKHTFPSTLHLRNRPQRQGHPCESVHAPLLTASQKHWLTK